MTKLLLLLRFTHLLLLILFWVIIYGFIDVLNKVEHFIKPAHRRILRSYTPKTGDILLVHYVGHGLFGIPMAESYPTHTAFVYVDDKGKAFALESTRFAAPEQPNQLLSTVHKLSGVRMVPLAHFVNTVDSVLYIRQLEESSIQIPSEHVQKQLEWASSLKFETRILDSMTTDVTIAIGFRLVWPNFSKWACHASKLDETKRRSDQVFCSEFVSRLLQRLGATRSDFDSHFLVSPASFLKTAGALENMSSPGYSWKPDQMLVTSF